VRTAQLGRVWKFWLRALIVVALILAIVLGIAQDQEVLQIESVRAAADPEFPAYVAALIGTALTTGNGFQVLVNGDAGRAAYERLMSRGVEIYEYRPTMMHAKVMVVDGVWSVFRSANFDNRSLELNDELNAAVADAPLAARFTSDFESDIRRATRLNLDEGVGGRCS